MAVAPREANGVVPGGSMEQQNRNKFGIGQGSGTV